MRPERALLAPRSGCGPGFDIAANKGFDDPCSGHAMRLSPAFALMAVLALAGVPAADAQSTASPPPFAAGANKSYCHVVDATNTIWMNTLEVDGEEVPYELFGEPAATDPVVGVGIDPVVDEAFEVRIPLSPALAQTLVLKGTVSATAYIGSGAYGGGSASIGIALVAGGAELGSAAEKDHRMAPKNGNAPQLGTTYEPISWTFDLAEATVPAGTTLEWVISGSATGNNVFLACHAARGRSFIEIPVVSATGGSAEVILHELDGAVARLNLSAGAPTNATHHYNWTTTLATQEMRILADVQAGNATLVVRDGGNATVYNATLRDNLTKELKGAAGNWTFTIELDAFEGNVTVEVGAPKPVVPATGSSSGSRTNSRTSSGTGAVTAGSDSESASGDANETPAAGLAVLPAALALAAFARRRRA